MHKWKKPVLPCDFFESVRSFASHLLRVLSLLNFVSAVRMGAGVVHSAEVRGQLSRVGSFLSCGFWGSTLVFGLSGEHYHPLTHLVGHMFYFKETQRMTK